MNKNRVLRSCHKNVNGETGGWDQVLTFTAGLIGVLDDGIYRHTCIYLMTYL